MLESIEFDEWISQYTERPNIYESLYRWNIDMKNEKDIFKKIKMLDFLYKNDKEKCKEFIETYLLKNTIDPLEKDERTKLYSYFDKYKENNDLRISIVEFSDLKSLFTFRK